MEALDRIEADNAELHAIAEQATMRAEQALAERDRYREALAIIATADISYFGARALARQALEGTDDE
jgi:precorrin-6B methylase 1